ncbi:hypothetical protein PR048_012193 [Dryococelus australis]|uniref:Uncharacterized protein n=1 Tax=Dryococelus australis TaxID=614101 RepID=A0ABQ9HNT3_9NEOP|nr:hypothetical protein PR048_012193 [Dryococelus australis]
MLHVVPDNAAGQWVFSGFSLLPGPFIPVRLHAHLIHPYRLSRPRCYELPHSLPGAGTIAYSLGRYCYYCTLRLRFNRIRNRIRLKRASQKQSSGIHETPCDRVKMCRERRIIIKASERVNSPTKVKRVQSPARSLTDFRMWESCRTMPLANGFPRRSPVSFALAFLLCSVLASVTLTGSQDLAAKRVKRDKCGVAPEFKGGKLENPEKTRRPAASSGTIPACEIPAVIEPGSPKREASSEQYKPLSHRGPLNYREIVPSNVLTSSETFLGKRWAVDNSAPIADLLGHKKRIPYCQMWGNTGATANEQRSEVDENVIHSWACLEYVNKERDKIQCTMKPDKRNKNPPGQEDVNRKYNPVGMGY